MQAMAVSYQIGPLGQPPTTTYYYDNDQVTMSPRAATVRSATEVASIVDSIRLFQRAVMLHDPNAEVIAVSDPFDFAFKEVAGEIESEFHCSANEGEMVAEARQVIATRITSFEARPERTIAWGDFLLFARWMEFVRYLATRTQV